MIKSRRYRKLGKNNRRKMNEDDKNKTYIPALSCQGAQSLMQRRHIHTEKNN